MFTFLLIVQTIVAAALVIVILMQRSEGGGLGVGGSSSGLMTARGAADFLTRATSILAFLFICLSIGLAGLAAVDRAPATIDPSLAKQAPSAPVQIPGQAPAQAPITDPLAGLGGATSTTPPTADSAAPNAQAPANGAVPLAQ